MASFKAGGNNSITKWKHASRDKLKDKIKSNLDLRGAKCEEIINSTLETCFNANNNNNNSFPFPIWTAESLINKSLVEMYKKVDNWKGVDILAMNKLPKNFNEYHKRADNWWNRYKAEWIGDYYFYPLLKHELQKYLLRICQHNLAMTELLYFMILTNIINAEIHYHRAKAQPLILDQSFIKSKDLEQLFHDIGCNHQVNWDIPINDSDVKY